MKKLTVLFISGLLLFIFGCTAPNQGVPAGGSDATERSITTEESTVIEGSTNTEGSAITEGSTNTEGNTNTEAIIFTDALGHRLNLENPRHVAVASGSFAEVWLLAGGTLVGATSDAFDDGFASAETVENIGGNHEPNLEQIIHLNPDLLILSADMSGHVKLYDSLVSAGLSVAYFSVENFEDYLRMLKICTEITGRDDLYEQNGVAMQSRIEEILSQTKGKPNPSVLLLRASSNKVVARNSETMTGIMLGDLGCLNIADSEASLLDNLSMEVIIKQDPDFIFVTTMGDSEEKAMQAMQDILLSNPAWENLSAVKHNRYFLLEKGLFHQKPNDRWAEAYEKLWEILYGES